MSLNCSLLFLRSEVVRYLFVHELAHTKHMNHSAELLASGGDDRAGLPALGPRTARRLAHGARLGIQDMSDARSRASPKPFVDLSDEQVHWDLSESLSYSQYLNLDKLLDAQHPLSYQHDEMLFIVIHQVSELWMKLCLHELGATVDCVRRDDLGPTFKMLARVSTIQQQLLQSWDVLATITPHDYSAFRNTLGKSSGFQSPQYRHAGVSHRQQECRYHQGVSRRSADLRDARARVARAEPVR